MGWFQKSGLRASYCSNRMEDEPAAVTGASEILSRAARKDIRKGTRCISLMALRALFDVSLQKVRNTTTVRDLITYERHHNTVITLSANS